MLDSPGAYRLLTVCHRQYPAPECGIVGVSGPSSPYDPTRIGFQGEFGGLGHNVSIDQCVDVCVNLDVMNLTPFD